MRWFSLRKFASIAVLLVVSLLVASCGGGSSSTPSVASVTSTTSASSAGSSAPSTQNQAMIAAGKCLRQHGLTNFSGLIIATSGPAKGKVILAKGSLKNYSGSVVRQALQACQAALAKAGLQGGVNSGPSPQQMQYLLAFAQCVRSHGISNFPDPTSQGQFTLTDTGINKYALTPAQLAAAKACLPVAHGTISIPPQGSSSSSGNGG